MKNALNRRLKVYWLTICIANFRRNRARFEPCSRHLRLTAIVRTDTTNRYMSGSNPTDGHEALQSFTGSRSMGLDHQIVDLLNALGACGRGDWKTSSNSTIHYAGAPPDREKMVLEKVRRLNNMLSPDPVPAGGGLPRADERIVRALESAAAHRLPGFSTGTFSHAASVQKFGKAASTYIAAAERHSSAFLRRSGSRRTSITALFPVWKTASGGGNRRYPRRVPAQFGENLRRGESDDPPLPLSAREAWEQAQGGPFQALEVFSQCRKWLAAGPPRTATFSPPRAPARRRSSPALLPGVAAIGTQASPVSSTAACPV